MCKKNFRLFIDMDDTLVDTHAGNPDADQKVFRTKGFFRNLKPLEFLNEMNKIASIFPQNVYIVSACVDSPYCVEEKIEWLKEYLPAAQKENIIFTKVGEVKSEIVKNKIKSELSKYDILIDDYSKNLREWESQGGTAIKFRNGFNGTTNSKYAYSIRNFSELLDTLEDIRKNI